jgi:hypothetical protein
VNPSKPVLNDLLSSRPSGLIYKTSPFSKNAELKTYKILLSSVIIIVEMKNEI